MSTVDSLAALNVGDPHAVRVYTGTVTAVNTTDVTCTVDPEDGGDPVDGVAYYGNTPTVGTPVLLFLFNNMLATITP